MDLLQFLGDLTIVVSITILIEVIKTITEPYVKIPPSAWLIAVFLAGIPAAFISLGMAGTLVPLNPWVIVGKSLTYSAFASLLYKTGSISIDGLAAFFGRKKDGG